MNATDLLRFELLDAMGIKQVLVYVKTPYGKNGYQHT
jgi:hypothetical protein